MCRWKTLCRGDTVAVYDVNVSRWRRAEVLAVRQLQLLVETASHVLQVPAHLVRPIHVLRSRAASPAAGPSGSGSPSLMRCPRGSLSGGGQ